MAVVTALSTAAPSTVAATSTARDASPSAGSTCATAPPPREPSRPEGGGRVAGGGGVVGGLAPRPGAQPLRPRPQAAAHPGLARARRRRARLSRASSPHHSRMKCPARCGRGRTRVQGAHLGSLLRPPLAGPAGLCERRRRDRVLFAPPPQRTPSDARHAARPRRRAPWPRARARGSPCARRRRSRVVHVLLRIVYVVSVRRVWRGVTSPHGTPRGTPHRTHAGRSMGRHTGRHTQGASE